MNLTNIFAIEEVSIMAFDYDLYNDFNPTVFMFQM